MALIGYQALWGFMENYQKNHITRLSFRTMFGFNLQGCICHTLSLQSLWQSTMPSNGGYGQDPSLDSDQVELQVSYLTGEEALRLRVPSSALAGSLRKMVSLRLPLKPGARLLLANAAPLAPEKTLKEQDIVESARLSCTLEELKGDLLFSHSSANWGIYWGRYSLIAREASNPRYLCASELIWGIALLRQWLHNRGCRLPARGVDKIGRLPIRQNPASPTQKPSNLVFSV